MKIRKFKEGDEKELSRLICNTLQEVNSKDYEENVIEMLKNRNSPERIVHCSKKGETFVAEKNGELVGTLTLYEERLIGGVFVRTDLIGKGIGSKLVKWIEKEVKKRGKGELVANSSITARKFYKKIGFKEIEEKVHEKDNVKFSIIEMRKSL